MDLLAAWLLFPLGLGLLFLGWGLLVDRVAGGELPGVLLLPVGLAAVFVFSRLIVGSDVAVSLGLPLLVAGAVVGFVLCRRRLLGLRPDGWAAAAAAGAALVVGAPVIFSGDPSFAGSLVLGDTAHQLSLAARLADAGIEWQSLPASSFSFGIKKYFITAYPLGPQAALGLLAPLGLIDMAWLFQPFLALLVAMAALSVNALISPWVDSRRLRALVSFVAAQPSLIVAFALQGSIKEIAALAMYALVFALATLAVTQRWPARAFVPLALAVMATVGALGPPAVAYIGIPLLMAAGVWVWRLRGAPARRELLWAGALIAATALLALPLLTGASTAVSVGRTVLADNDLLGNLAGPLDLAQASGGWLTGDYRYPPPAFRLAQGVAALLGLLALLGLVMAARRRSLGPLLLAVAVLPVSALLLVKGSPYADAKVLALASPVVPLLGMTAAVWLASSGERRRRLAGVAVALFVTGAVLGSNALAYHETPLAPYDRYEELSSIGDRFGAQGPMLLPDYDEYSKYFLRDGQPLSPPEYPYEFPFGPLKLPRWDDGVSDSQRQPSLKAPLDVDALPQPTLQVVSTIVRRHAPTASRPPSNFRRVYSGRYYEVWKRTRVPVLLHKTLGETAFSPANPPVCADVRSMARKAATIGGRLAYVERRRPPIYDPRDDALRNSRFGFPDRFWYTLYPKSLTLKGAGKVDARFRVPRAGRYRIWLMGSFSRRFDVRIDGRHVGSVAYELGNAGAYLELGKLRLTTGVHQLKLAREGGDLRPGNGGGFASNLVFLGPLVLSDLANERLEVRHVSPKRARSLCGRRLDWIEVVL